MIEFEFNKEIKGYRNCNVKVKIVEEEKVIDSILMSQAYQDFKASGKDRYFKNHDLYYLMENSDMLFNIFQDAKSLKDVEYKGINLGIVTSTTAPYSLDYIENTEFYASKNIIQGIKKYSAVPNKILDSKIIYLNSDEIQKEVILLNDEIAIRSDIFIEVEKEK